MNFLQIGKNFRDDISGDQEIKWDQSNTNSSPLQVFNYRDGRLDQTMQPPTSTCQPNIFLDFKPVTTVVCQSISLFSLCKNAAF
jgi:hypothetical protein